MPRPKSEHEWTSTSARLTRPAKHLLKWYADAQKMTINELLWSPGLALALAAARRFAASENRATPPLSELDPESRLPTE